MVAEREIFLRTIPGEPEGDVKIGVSCRARLVGHLPNIGAFWTAANERDPNYIAPRNFQATTNWPSVANFFAKSTALSDLKRVLRAVIDRKCGFMAARSQKRPIDLITDFATFLQQQTTLHLSSVSRTI